MINKARAYLIRVGKVLPFVICFLVCFNYLENIISITFNDYINYGDYIIPNTPLSFFIGSYFEYNVQMLVVLTILSIAIQTCRWNKLACLYLGINLIEKSYFDFELDIETKYCICIINIIASTYLTYKGIKIITSNDKRVK